MTPRMIHNTAAPMPFCYRSRLWPLMFCHTLSHTRTGDSKEEIAKSPFVERLLQKGYEVIYFTDVLDEYVMQVRTIGVCVCVCVCTSVLCACVCVAA